MLRIGKTSVLDKKRIHKNALVLKKEVFSDFAPPTPEEFSRYSPYPPRRLNVVDFENRTYGATLRLETGELSRIESDSPLNFLSPEQEVRVIEETTTVEHLGLFRKRKEVLKKIRTINGHIL